MNTRYYLILVSITFMFAACATLQPVREVTTKATNALILYEELPVTYLQFCEDRCQFNLARKNQIVRDSAIDCDCKVFRQADQATGRVYRTITAYFKSLSELADGELTTVNTKALNETIIEGNFAGLTIEKPTVNAYGALAKVVITAFTEEYRRNKIKQVIESANPSLQVLIPVFQASLQNLVTELEFQKERNYALYNELIRENLNAVERNRIAREYYQELNKINMIKEKIETYSSSLATIAKGHQRLFDNRDKLTGKEFIAGLAEFSGTLQDLITAFRKI